jgi:hypothetical protein
MPEPKKNSPWYAPPQREETPFVRKLEALYKKWLSIPSPSTQNLTLLAFAAALLMVATAGFVFAFAFWPTAYTITKFLALALGLAIALVGAWAAFHTVGVAAKPFSKCPFGEPTALTGMRFLKCDAELQETRGGVPAPELALQSFLQQVRAYASEVAYVRNRELRGEERKPGSPDPTEVMKRRWNEVVDSLNEFDLYLSNSPKAFIENLISQSPTQHMDVSQVFRDVADVFDTTWRRKGINIESAIVSPLKATANEALLRRLLVGPWRSSAYFARRGTGVVFSAKCSSNTVVATWETNGLCIPESFLTIALNSEIPINQRLETGMKALSSDPASAGNTFLGLLSFLTWIDLAKASNAQFELTNASEGFQISLRLN